MFNEQQIYHNVPAYFIDMYSSTVNMLTELRTHSGPKWKLLRMPRVIFTSY